MEKEYYRHTPAERKAKITDMIEAKWNNRLTDEELARDFNINRTTLHRWKMTDEWKDEERKFREAKRNDLRSDIHNLGPDMISVLQELAHGIPSHNGEKIGSFTRFSAAKTLLEFVGLDQENEERKLEQGDEFIDFMKSVKKNNRKADHNPHLDIEVLPGGMLPPVIVEQNEEMRDAIFAEQDEIEAEFTTLERQDQE